jgi:hypothetical protein
VRVLPAVDRGLVDSEELGHLAIGGAELRKLAGLLDVLWLELVRSADGERQPRAVGFFGPGCAPRALTLGD